MEPRMELITFDMKDAQGSTKHRLVSVFKIIVKIISNVNLKGILILLGGLAFRNRMCRWPEISRGFLFTLPFRTFLNLFSLVIKNENFNRDCS
jgi:hypothetical protein